MAITGYKPNGEPMFDNAIEYAEYCKHKQIEEYNNRSKYQIIEDIRHLNELMDEYLMKSAIDGISNRKDSIIRLKCDIDKEWNLLLSKLEE